MREIQKQYILTKSRPFVPPPYLQKKPKENTREFYLDILGLGRDATDQNIKTNWRQIARKYHPDRCHGDISAQEKFLKAKEAYEMLLKKNI